MCKDKLNTWGTYLALIPFIVLVLYGIAVISGYPNSGAWLAQKIVIFIVSAVVFIGIALLVGKR